MAEDRDPASKKPRSAPDGREPALDLAALPEIAAWIAVAAASGVIGNAVYDYLNAFLRRFGRRRLDGLEEQVFQELKRVKRKPHVSDADLRLRVEHLFDAHRN